MPLRPILAATLGLALTACAIPRPPELRARVQSDLGIVRADVRETAQEMAALLDEIGPRVLATLPGLDGRDVDVRFVERLGRPNWGGVTFKTPEQRWIEMPDKMLIVDAKKTLAHELVHFWTDATWSVLPSVIEEGLCDWVAHHAVPEAAPLERLHAYVTLMTLIDQGFQFEVPDLRVAYFGEPVPLSQQGTTLLFARYDRARVPPPREALAMTSPLDEPIGKPGIREPLDAIGLFVVERVGVDDLRVLCQRARAQGLSRVPAEWILAAAALDPDSYEAWRPAVERSYGHTDRRALEERLRGPAWR